MPQQFFNDIFHSHFFVQKDIYKEIHWAINYLESMVCHDHVFHEKGVSHGVFQILSDVCLKPTINQDYFP